MPDPSNILRALALLCGMLLAALHTTAAAHPGDFANLVWLEIEITDQHVEQRVMVPLGQALDEVFGGITLDAFRQRDPQAVLTQLTAFHTATNPLTVNGLPVQPILRDAEVTVPATATPEAVIDPEQYERHAVLAYTATYPTVGRPARVGLVWGVFATEAPAFSFTPPDVDESSAPGERLPLVAEVNALGMTKLLVLSPEEPGYTWHGKRAAPPVSQSAATGPRTPAAPNSRPRGTPVLIIVLVATGLLVSALLGWKYSIKWVPAALIATMIVTAICFPYGWIAPAEDPVTTATDLDEAQAIAVFTELHRNIYRAFDYNTDSAVYDALAQSVAGPELETTFNEVYASLVLQEEGGAVSKVQAVEILEARVVGLPPIAGKTDANRRRLADPLGPAPFAVRCAWTVRGLVSHFGHTHERRNAFEATYTLAPRDGEWRIIDTELHRQERLDDPAEGSGPNLDNLLGTDDP